MNSQPSPRAPHASRPDVSEWSPIMVSNLEPNPASNPRVWIAVLRQSHDRLLSLVGPLSPEQISGPSYCKDWSIAQVLSHLGSGAEIAMMTLPSALGQSEPVDRAEFQPIW